MTIEYPASFTKHINSLKYAPSSEQMAAVDAVLSSKDNLLINALAGAAKTTTLKMIAHALPKVNMICLAFNKAIAMEMKAELPSHCTAQTLNSLGYQVWRTRLGGRRIYTSTNKMYGIVSDLINAEPGDAARQELFEDFAYILQACNHAKSAGHLPNKFFDQQVAAGARVDRILDDEDLILSLDEEVSGPVKRCILKALNISAEQAMEGQMDFNDQILMPSLFKCIYPIYSLILIDEAQDLSALNHLMLKQLYRRRIIAVGDQNQAIYAFRGAYESGMEEMKKAFDMQELTLSTTYRCSTSVVDHVKWRTPNMKAADSAPEGSVKTYAAWSADDLPENCAVLCRNNAPLLRAAVRLIRSGRAPKVWGNDIAKGLLKNLKSLGPTNMKQDSAMRSLDIWLETRLKKVKRPGPTKDQYECLKIFIEGRETLADAIDYAEYVFRSTGQVDLLTCHKSKGHEFSEVFILDEDLMSEEGQDPNLRYVAATRSKLNLYYIKTDEYIGPDGEAE
jgi:superfamily I DNA/RNA helicase